MRVQGTGRKQWRGCFTDTMNKESRGCEKDGVHGMVRKDGSWVGLGDETCGCKSYFYAFGVQEKPWEHVDRRSSMSCVSSRNPGCFGFLVRQSDCVLEAGHDVSTTGRKTGIVSNLHVNAARRPTRGVGASAA